MDSLELNMRIANCHPLELEWISKLVFAVRIEEDQDEVMRLMGELLMHPEPLDTWYLTVSMFLDQPEVDFLEPILRRITESEDYFYAEFCVHAHD